MKLKNPSPFAADYPALHLVDVPPEGEFEVPDEAIAESLLRQGHEPVDKEAKDLLKKINTPEPVAAPEPPKEA